MDMYQMNKQVNDVAGDKYTYLNIYLLNNRGGISSNVQKYIALPGCLNVANDFQILPPFHS